jgi:hypothetical protein
LAIDIRCPGCGYSPVQSAITDPKLMSDIMRYPVCETQDDVLDCFDVLGADEGNLICLECAREFNPNELLLSKTKEKSMTKQSQ